MKINDLCGNSIETDCVGCYLLSSIKKKLLETENFVMYHDPEISLPGFCVITMKRHQEHLDQEDISVKYELIELIDQSVKVIKDYFKIKDVTIVYKAPTSHFYVMLVPVYEENLKKYGDKLGGITELVREKRRDHTKGELELIDSFINNFSNI